MLATALGFRIAGSCPAAATVAASDLLSLRARGALTSASMNARLQNPYALNADMEFMTRPLETVKLYRKAR
jgi:hypothetical protein